MQNSFEAHLVLKNIPEMGFTPSENSVKWSMVPNHKAYNIFFVLLKWNIQQIPYKMYIINENITSQLS